MTTRSAEQIADLVRTNYAVTAGRQGFLADPGGWLDLLLSDGTPPTDDDHAAARAAIELIAADAENAALPETPAQIVTELAIEHGIDNAYVLDDAVHVPTGAGSLFLTITEDAHRISTIRPGSRPVVVWADEQARSITGAVGMLARLVTAADADRTARTPPVPGAAGDGDTHSSPPATDAGDVPAYVWTMPTTGHLCLHYSWRDGQDPGPAALVFYERREAGDERAREYLADQLQVLGRNAPADVVHRLVMVERDDDSPPDRVIAEATVRGSGTPLAGRDR
jgi:hypothetical protein